MDEKLENFVRRLSDIFDSESEDTFVSLYVNKDVDKKFLDRRESSCKAVLKNDELENFLQTMESIREAVKIDKKHKDNIVVFASNKNNLFEKISLPIDFENLLVVDSSPYLKPLVRVFDEWEDFTLVLMNTHYAKIFDVSLGEVEKTKKVSSDIMNKHKKGGWSQTRFNRLRRGAIKNFYSNLIELLEKHDDNPIVLSGPGEAKIQFEKMLPSKLKEKIVDVIDVDIQDENEILKKSFQIVSEDEEKRSCEAVKLLKQEILKEGLAVYGVEETLEAVKNGQVELLIIEKDYRQTGWICEHCQLVKTGYRKKCPYCNNETSKVDLIEEILEFAERTDSKIEFTDDERIADLGHVGGILRFKV